ncbi:hypothetical protein ACFL27_21755 [candidate division CSSED10-310 bacterium]|uniref:FecR protein domain-containing protein n=1 Tax=candidate division CSSED10-310 bacterium TaxID=2855610 RepID=A0ABV6Z2Z8_UNCC1
MKKLTSIICFLFLFSGFSTAEQIKQKFGKIFDVQGQVVITTAKGDTIELKRDKHILFTVEEGDEIKTEKDGKILIVANKDGKGYYIMPSSVVSIKNNELDVEGTVEQKDGLNTFIPSDEGDIGGKIVGGIVYRSAARIKIIRPTNTAILELTPELQWKVFRTVSQKFKLNIFSDDDVIYSAESETSSLRVPEGLLKYGQTYRWIVDGGLATGISGGVFFIPEKEKIAEFKQKIAQNKPQNGDLPQTLSYIFFLMNNKLNIEAEKEIKILLKEFPHNEYLKELAEE